jgi:hypothetical protein
MKKILLQIILLITTITGLFAQATTPNLVISEIYYNAPNSGADSMEYVEIYNRGTVAQNLKNFTFRSAFIDTLPDFTLDAGQFYVVTSDATFFAKATKTTAHQWKSGTLANTGETIQLFSNDGTFVDSVRFRTVAPWPTTPNGNGPSMELCNVATGNNDVGTSWGAATTPIGYSLTNQNGQSIALLGTPGKANTCTSGGGGTGGSFVAKDINSRTNKNTAVNINIAQPNMVQANTITSSEVVKQPTNGTAAKAVGGGGGGAVNNAAFTYTPKAGFVGTDKFEYSMCTANGCDTAVINIMVIEPAYNSSTIGKITAQTAIIGTQPDSLNRYVEIEGVVHSPNFSTNGIQFTLIDQKYKNDGIEIARNATIGGYVVKEGDLLRVKGRVAQTAGINRLNADTLWVKQSDIKLHDPIYVSVLDESTENSVVALEGVSIVDSTKWNNTGTGNNFVVEVTPDGGATKYQVRIDKDIAELSNWTAPKGKFDLSGIGYQAAAGGGGGGGLTTTYQIMPRYKADFKFATAANDIQLGKLINVYPNPFSEEIVVQLASTMDLLLVQDIFGKMIVKIIKPYGNQIITSDNWAAGVYFVTLQKDGKQFVTKLVKQ